MRFKFDWHCHTGSGGCSANWTDCDVVLHPISGRPWTSYRRRWTRVMSAHYSTSMMKIGCMPIDSSNVLWLLTVRSTLKSSPISSRSNPKEEVSSLNGIGGQKTQEIGCCL